MSLTAPPTLPERNSPLPTARRSGRWTAGSCAGLVVAALIAGCSWLPITRRPATVTCCPAPGVDTHGTTAPLSGDSLYQIESSWTTDAGQPLKFKALRGRVQLVVMFFASCQYACPVIVHDLKRIESALPADVRAQVGFTLVTFDVARDTPEVLRTYRERQQLADPRWTFLRGTPDDTLELAALLGVQYRRETNGQFTHSNLITLLNAEGEIIHRQVGLNQDIQETVKAIQTAVR